MDKKIEIDKELALAIDFKKAPADLQLLATTHYTNIKNVAKAQKKINDAQIELETALRTAEESAKNLRLGLRRWEPEI